MSAVPTRNLLDGHRPALSGPRSRGFTLVEALVVMSIIAILLAVAMPAFRDFAAARAVSAQISDFAGSLRLARTEAIKRGRAVLMCRTNDPQAATPACNAGADWRNGWLIMQGGNLIRLQASYLNSGGIVSGAGLAAIVFTPSGIAPAGSETSFTFRPPLAASDPSYEALTRRICVGVTGVTRPC